MARCSRTPADAILTPFNFRVAISPSLSLSVRCRPKHSERVVVDTGLLSSRRLVFAGLCKAARFFSLLGQPAMRGMRWAQWAWRRGGVHRASAGRFGLRLGVQVEGAGPPRQARRARCSNQSPAGARVSALLASSLGHLVCLVALPPPEGSSLPKGYARPIHPTGASLASLCASAPTRPLHQILARPKSFHHRATFRDP